MIYDLCIKFLYYNYERYVLICEIYIFFRIFIIIISFYNLVYVNYIIVLFYFYLL